MQVRQSPDALVSFSDFLLERFGLVPTMQVAVVGSLAFHLLVILGLGMKLPPITRLINLPGQYNPVVPFGCVVAPPFRRCRLPDLALFCVNPSCRSGVLGWFLEIKLPEVWRRRLAAE